MLYFAGDNCAVAMPVFVWNLQYIAAQSYLYFSMIPNIASEQLNIRNLFKSFVNAILLPRVCEASQALMPNKYVVSFMCKIMCVPCSVLWKNNTI